MTNAQDALNNYTTHQRGEEDLRDTEARALLSCASRLEKARTGEGGQVAYYEALRHNQQLWTVFQVCLCEPENQLPQDLKFLLLNLSRYVDKTSFKAMGVYNPELLKSLIEINRNIAAGLGVKQQAATAPSMNAPVTTPPPTMTAGSVMTSA